MANLLLPSSAGDAFDRLTILEIKSRRLSTDRAKANAKAEARLILKTLEQVIEQPPIQLIDELRAVNEAIYDLMELIFDSDKNSVDYLENVEKTIWLNQERAVLKRKINDQTGSALIEEKSYFD